MESPGPMGSFVSGSDAFRGSLAPSRGSQATFPCSRLRASPDSQL